MAENLRNRNKMSNGVGKKSNGFARSQIHLEEPIAESQAADDLLETKKKILMMVEENNNESNATADQQETDTFADTFTLTPKQHSRPSQQDQEPIEIYNKSARDQFAAALLKLQNDLDLTSKKLHDIENKMDSFQSKIARQQQADKDKATKAAAKSSGLFNKSNITANLIYFGWPVVVYLAFRAIERRNAAASLKTMQ